MLTTLGLLVVALSAFAEATADKPKPLEVTAADIAQAGYSNVQPVAPAGDRWNGPTEYFTSNAYIPQGDVKKDCADCQKVVAAYAAVTDKVPGWSLNQHVFVRKIAGRFQGRAFLPDKKTVIVVTGPNEALITKLLDVLKTKFAQ